MTDEQIKSLIEQVVDEKFAEIKRAEEAEACKVHSVHARLSREKLDE